MGNLRSAVDELAAEDLAGVEPGALGEDVVELTKQLERLDAERLRRLRRFELSGAWAQDGSLSTQSWLRNHTRMGAGEAAERVRVARRLEDMPLTGAAFAEGEIGYRHVRVIARAVDTSPACAQALADVESLLVDYARERGPSSLARVVDHWKYRVDADAFERGEQERFDRRDLKISSLLDGMHALGGLLDAEGAAIVKTALNAYDKPLPDERRCAGQRRADALIEICRQSLERRELPTTGGEKPHLNLDLPLETLEQRAGAPAATVRWGGPISGEAARRLACDCGLSRIITDGNSEPLDVGRRTRTIPAALRRAVIARDQTCVHPGCDRPPEWCDVHHRIHWLDGGETKLSNLELRCHYHHRHEHEGKKARAP